jgi:2-polyprenyl-6-hydroxyphenyl methylase/3-demethylubiquinone-9 3-methyltransferase
MPVDNMLYERLSETWWDETGFLSILRSALNPPRLGYMRRVLAERGVELAGASVLDVGSGGGLLAEEFARLGCHVCGIDPSRRSVEVACAHAAEAGLEIDYEVGVAEQLPYADGSFDVVYCCDVLEHVDDVARTIAESARVLAPGGIYLYDTLNRTVRSWLIAIKLWQEWDSTHFMPPNIHDWRMFIKPREMAAHLRVAGLQPGPTQGIAPVVPPPKLLALLRARRRGEMTYGEFGRALALHESRDRSILYTGCATKPGPTSTPNPDKASTGRAAALAAS